MRGMDSESNIFRIHLILNLRIINHSSLITFVIFDNHVNFNAKKLHFRGKIRVIEELVFLLC